MYRGLAHFTLTRSLTRPKENMTDLTFSAANVVGSVPDAGSTLALPGIALNSLANLRVDVK